MSELFTNSICEVTEKVSNFDPEKELEKLFQKYPNIVKNDMSAIKNYKAKLYLKEGAKPVFVKACHVSFKLIPLVEVELKKLESQCIIEKVATAEYATPVVPILKKDGSVRLCGDFSVTVNPQLRIEEYHLPTTDELLSDIAGCEVFAKIDLLQHTYNWS